MEITDSATLCIQTATFTLYQNTPKHLHKHTLPWRMSGQSVTQPILRMNPTAHSGYECDTLHKHTHTRLRQKQNRQWWGHTAVYPTCRFVGSMLIPVDTKIHNKVSPMGSSPYPVSFFQFIAAQQVPVRLSLPQRWHSLRNGNNAGTHKPSCQWVSMPKSCRARCKDNKHKLLRWINRIY